MKFFLVVALATSFCICTARASEPPKLPAEVEQALSAPEKVVLYSLQPGLFADEEDKDKAIKDGKLFHDQLILGTTPLNKQQTQVAVAAFKSAIAESNGYNALCFNPRHGLHVVFHHHIFDFLLCYECGYLVVYEDDKGLWSSHATGSPKVLNDLLTAAHVPLSEFYSEASTKAREAQQKEYQAERERWVAAMPKSLRPLLVRSGKSKAVSLGQDPDQTLLLALSAEFPDENKRILVLLAWYGSGAGPWSGFPSYEEMPDQLLLRFPTSKIISVVQSTSMSEAQMEGAARFFGGWDFSHTRPNDLKLLPADLKKELLDQALKSKNEDNIKRARIAFGGP